MKNSNLVHIALDWQKQKQRRENAKAVAPITILCNKKKILFNVNIDEGITIDNKFFFNFNQIKEAIEFVKEYESNLNYWRK